MISDFHLVNKTLPWDYSFRYKNCQISYLDKFPCLILLIDNSLNLRFVIEEISNINDKAQTMSISMYFAVSWLEPR